MARHEGGRFGFFGMMSFVTAGGFLLWRNRFRIQRLLEANGISTPWLKGSIGEAVNSGVAKITGSVEQDVNVTKDEELPRSAAV